MQQDATRIEKKRVELRSRGSRWRRAIAARPENGARRAVSSARRFRKSCERHPFTFIPRRAEGVREGRRGGGGRFERKRGQKNEDNGPAEQLSGQEKRRSGS